MSTLSDAVRRPPCEHAIECSRSCSWAPGCYCRSDKAEDCSRCKRIHSTAVSIAHEDDDDRTIRLIEEGVRRGITIGAADLQGRLAQMTDMADAYAVDGRRLTRELERVKAEVAALRSKLGEG